MKYLIPVLLILLLGCSKKEPEICYTCTTVTSYQAIGANPTGYVPATQTAVADVCGDGARDAKLNGANMVVNLGSYYAKLVTTCPAK
ncbi:hypothetical protein [Fibrivirga algicola]|uniref:Lipoprotein n=1 Tax=Fibrivirga algicola TaxID=2950420 RepID=A0ABX0QAP4_9BACT|nr:hypothetical protein [Fibrivirga algicola]NID09339.1 hypothetical protein [Fibrivirga algicola]